MIEEEERIQALSFENKNKLVNNYLKSSIDVQEWEDIKKSI